MPSILITGANRGLGLEFASRYAEDGWRVFATCRNPAEASALGRLAGSHPNLSLHRLDLRRFEDMDELTGELAAEPLDVLLNNAAIYGDEKDRGFGHLDYTRWAEVMKINVMAQVRMTEAFLPQLRLGSRKLVVSITSLMGSIADNGSGGSILYRSSKAALNAAMKSIAIDLRDDGVGVLLLHPGWVQTDMGGPQAPTSKGESIAGMRQLIESFTHDASGRFLDFRGRELPW